MSAQPADESIQEDAQYIEIDDAVSDSAFGEDTSVLSASITSSIKAYRVENGRRYHAFKDGSYFFPNDEMENDRLDMQHALFLKSCKNQLYLAPIRDNVQHVLDLGTWTGIWALDFADTHPSAEVIGTDLSPIQPSWVPPNLKFVIDDCEDEWLFKQKFDLIHARMMCGSLQD